MGEKEITALLRDSQANNAITHLAGGEYPWIPLSHRESLFAGTSCGSQSLGLSVAGWQGGREPEWGTGFEWLLICVLWDMTSVNQLNLLQSIGNI